MYKHPHKSHNTLEMNYLVPGLAFFTAKGFGLATLVNRFFDFLIAWAERMARRSTRI